MQQLKATLLKLTGPDNPVSTGRIIRSEVAENFLHFNPNEQPDLSTVTSLVGKFLGTML